VHVYGIQVVLTSFLGFQVAIPVEKVVEKVVHKEVWFLRPLPDDASQHHHSDQSFMATPCFDCAAEVDVHAAGSGRANYREGRCEGG
jgi:hypothetical protein